jgi:broad specificity phosphatase PhoE
MPPHSGESLDKFSSQEKSANEDFTPTSSRRQSLFIIRHGDRWDYQHPEWRETAKRIGDPSLSTLGHEQARQVGQYLDQRFLIENIHANQITLLSSPFLRTIQTANELLGAMKYTKGCAPGLDSIKILPEYSVFELDLWGQDLHACLPDLEERKCYFPRLDTDYQSMFIPSFPETQDMFFQRCEESMRRISDEFAMDESDDKHRVIIVVTHAACCIGLVQAATGLELGEINPAAPCSIYMLTREGNENMWKIDPYSKVNGLNGFTGHIDDMGTCTKPWHHFGKKEVNDGYTGPCFIEK